MNVAPVRRRFLFVYVSIVCDDLVLHVYAWVWQPGVAGIFVLVCSVEQLLRCTKVQDDVSG